MKRSLSFVLPMYNEAEIIKGTIESLTRVARGLTYDYEIVIVDDASTDGSGSIVTELAEKNNRIRLITLEKNTMFAGALKKGLQSAVKEVIVYTDSDLGIDEEDIRKALALIEKADIVNTFSQRQKGETLWRMMLSIVYNSFVNSLFKLHVRDINSSFKIFRRSALQGMELISRSPFIDGEILIRAKAAGRRIVQTPIVFKDPLTRESAMGRPSIILATFRDILKFFLKKIGLR